MVLSLYLDADSCWDRLVAALSRLGFDLALGTVEMPDGTRDEDHLIRATELGRLLVTANAVDFARISHEWNVVGRPHPGILIRHQVPPRSPETVAQRIGERLSSMHAAEAASIVLWI